MAESGTTNGASRDEAIEAFAREWLRGPNQKTYEQMLDTLCRMNRDGADLGEAKLISRSLAELRYGFKVFAPFRQTRKVSIFGSSRTPPDDPDYIAPVDYAKAMTANGWMVITGAGDGIMKAGHGGAGREASFGVAIRLPFEQKTNDIIADDHKLANFNYFFTRKLFFLKEASAVVLFPGGFGTQDEGFEALTLVQTGKSPVVPIVMLEKEGGRYWPHWREYVDEQLLKRGMISNEDLELFHITDNIDEAVQEVLQFYKVHHSNRYVGKNLVLRLERSLSHETLEQLNDEFAEKILLSGRIEQCSMLPEEEGEFPEKPRLTFHFNKRNFGTLRRMIDMINNSV